MRMLPLTAVDRTFFMFPSPTPEVPRTKPLAHVTCILPEQARYYSGRGHLPG